MTIHKGYTQHTSGFSLGRWEVRQRARGRNGVARCLRWEAGGPARLVVGGLEASWVLESEGDSMIS